MYTLRTLIAGQHRRFFQRVHHFHQDECSDGEQHEAGECDQESAIDGEHGGREHHQKRKHRQKIMITIALGGEQTDKHHEQNQVHGGPEERAGNKKIIEDVKTHAGNGQDVGPTFG